MCVCAMDVSRAGGMHTWSALGWQADGILRATGLQGGLSHFVHHTAKTLAFDTWTIVHRPLYGMFGR